MSAAPRGGRRAAPRQTRRSRAAQPRRYRGDRTTVAALAALLVAALLVFLASERDTAGVAAPLGTAQGALVDRTLLACPDTTDNDLRGRFDAGLAPVEDAGDKGVLEAGAVGEGGQPVSISRGGLEQVEGPPAPVLDASGEVAVGLFGFRTDLLADGTAVGTCVPPRASWWFVGSGADLDHYSELVLTNVDPGPAVVDVRVFGPDGEIETIGTRGIPIGPGETEPLALADAAPQNAEVMVQVHASRGRVAAAMSDRFAPRPAGPAGADWLTGTAEPGQALRVAGLPEAASSRTLLVGNPSDLEALVEVEVSGSGGTYVPTGLETLSVAPGTVEELDLGDALTAKEASSVRIRSRAPVVAAVRSVAGSDASYAEPVSVLDGPAAVPVLERSRTTVQLTAGTEESRVGVAAYSAGGRPLGEERVTVAPTATTTWEPPRESAYVVVTPRQGSVYGAATYASSTGIATVPLTPLPFRLPLPAVVPGPR